MSEVPISLLTDKAGIWIIREDGFERLGSDLPTPAVVYVPSEDVATFVADLPLPSRSQRLAAAPFAIEDRLAEPLERLHIALGLEVLPRRYVIGAVRRDRMAAWIDQLETFGLGKAALTPDIYRLPPPANGAWSVRIDGDRALVRQSDGTGFALPNDLLLQAWEAAGKPSVGLSAGVLPLGLDAAPAPLQLGVPEARPALNLRQGIFTVRRQTTSDLVRAIAAILVVGIVAHIAIAAVDLVSLKRISAKKHSEALALIQQVSPSVTAKADLLQELDAILPAFGSAASGGFFPLLTRSSAALQPLGTAISYRALNYGEREQALQLKIEAADRVGLQAAESALTAAGLEVGQGASSVETGRASGDLTLRQRGAAP